MLWIFWIIVVLIALLLIPNALYAVRYSISTKKRAWFVLYAVFLAMLGFILSQLSVRAFQFIQTAKEEMVIRDN